MARSFIAASSQYIQVNSAPSINLGSVDFTVLAWVRFPTEPPDNSMIVGKRAGGFDGDEGWELKINNGGDPSVRWDVETDTTGRQRAEATIGALTDGNWHLLAGDRDTDLRLRLWFDGAVVNTKAATTTGSVNTTTPMVVGAAYDTPTPTSYLTGEIGPVFICDRILSDGEHAWLAKRFSGLFLRPTPRFLLQLISRAAANEPDIGGGLLGALGNGPEIVDNPRLIYPADPYVGQDLWYERATATIAGQSSLTAIQTRGRTANAVIAGQSALTASVSVRVPIAATIAAQSTISADIMPDAAARAAITAQSTVSAAANIRASVGTIPIAGRLTISPLLSAKVPVAATVAAQSSVTSIASPRAGVAATIAGQSAIVATGDRIRTISAALAGQSSLTATATIEARLQAQISGQSSLSALLAATVPASVTFDGQSAIAVLLSAEVPCATTLNGQSAVAATVTRARPAESTIAAQSALAAALAARLPLTAAIAGQSALSVDLSARAGVVATIVGQSAMPVRPTYLGEPITTQVGGSIEALDFSTGKIINTSDESTGRVL
jgi:hypothetical protein